MAETITILEDSDGQLLLDLRGVVDQMGWTEETLLEWELTENGAILRAKDDTTTNI